MDGFAWAAPPTQPKEREKGEPFRGRTGRKVNEWWRTRSSFSPASLALRLLVLQLSVSPLA